MNATNLVYSQDSPLFAKSVNDFTQDILKLAEFLKSLVRLMRQFCKDLRNTAKCGEALSIQMQQGFRSSKHHSLIPIINLFGEVFSEVAASQEILSETLEQTFVVPLESFFSNSMSNIVSIRQQYVKDRDMNDETVIKYLQSDYSTVFARSVQSDQVELRALEVVNQRKKLEMTRFDLIRQINEVEARKSFELAETCISAMVSLRTHHHRCSDKLLSIAPIINEHSIRQQRERQEFMSSQIPVQRYRQDITTVLESMVERVQTQIPQESSSLSSTSSTSLTASSSIHLNLLLTPEHIFIPVIPDNQSQGHTNDSSNLASVASNAFSKIGKFGAMGVVNLMTGFKGTNTNTNANSTRSLAATTATERESSGSGRDSLSYRRSMASSSSPSYHDAISNNELTNASSSSSSSVDCVVEAIENRMKALDRSELDSLFRINPMEAFAGVIKEGYILQKTFGKLSQQIIWTRRWLIVDETKLYFVKEGDTLNAPLEVHVLCDIMLASVRELKTCTPDCPSPYCFEIAHANIKTYSFQAEGPRDYSSWVESIRTAIERRLTSGITSTTATSTSSSKSSQNNNNDMSRKDTILQHVQEIMAKNNFCAECNRKDPDWVSLNLGCLICIDCSGVHRSLGVHISKVRSLTLDELEPHEYELLKALGNECSNGIWEADLASQIDITKPGPQSNYSSRDKFIKAKYQHKKFLGNIGRHILVMNAKDQTETEVHSSDLHESAKSNYLIEACTRDDVCGLMAMIAHDFSINGYLPSSSSSTKPSSLPISADCSFDKSSLSIPLDVAAAYGSLHCLVLLLVNGADIYSNGHSSAKSYSKLSDLEAIRADDIARAFGHERVSNYIIRKAEMAGRPRASSSAPTRAMLSLNDANSNPATSAAGATSSAGDSSNTGVELSYVDGSGSYRPSSPSTAVLMDSLHSDSSSGHVIRAPRSASASSISAIGEKFYLASESNTPASILEKIRSSQEANVDKLKQGMKKVFHTHHTAGSTGDGSGKDSINTVDPVLFS